MVKRRSGNAAAGTQQISAAAFKATCLELMDQVREAGIEYVVTKHGKPVARLVPYVEPAPKKRLGLLDGSILNYERPTDPLDDVWEMEQR